MKKKLKKFQTKINDYMTNDLKTSCKILMSNSIENEYGVEDCIGFVIIDNKTGDRLRDEENNKDVFFVTTTSKDFLKQEEDIKSYLSYMWDY